MNGIIAAFGDQCPPKQQNLVVIAAGEQRIIVAPNSEYPTRRAGIHRIIHDIGVRSLVPSGAPFRCRFERSSNRKIRWTFRRPGGHEGYAQMAKQLDLRSKPRQARQYFNGSGSFVDPPQMSAETMLP
jgi:hypothetical protein